jgi:hypothetical protein
MAARSSRQQAAPKGCSSLAGGKQSISFFAFCVSLAAHSIMAVAVVPALNLGRALRHLLNATTEREPPEITTQP